MEKQITCEHHLKDKNQKYFQYGVKWPQDHLQPTLFRVALSPVELANSQKGSKLKPE